MQLVYQMMMSGKDFLKSHVRAFHYRPTWNWQCHICNRVDRLFYAITSSWMHLRECVTTIVKKLTEVTYVRYMLREGGKQAWVQGDIGHSWQLSTHASFVSHWEVFYLLHLFSAPAQTTNNVNKFVNLSSMVLFSLYNTITLGMVSVVDVDVRQRLHGNKQIYKIFKRPYFGK